MQPLGVGEREVLDDHPAHRRPDHMGALEAGIVEHGEDGLCLTAGFELALACDLIWAAESARFGLVEIVVGVSPFMGGTQRVAERAGPARARELVMSGGLFEAATLELWNVVNRVVAEAELLESATSFAERLAAGPTRAHAATKRVVRAFLDEGVRGADAGDSGERKVLDRVAEAEEAQGELARVLR